MVFAASPLPIVVLDPEGKVRKWSPAAERLFGWRETEVLGADLPFATEESGDALRGLQARVLGGETVLGAPVSRCCTKAGTPVSFLLSASPWHAADGSVIGLCCQCLDITKDMELEHHLRCARRLDDLGLLAAGIAHDLNNTLAPIMLMSPLLRAEVTSAPARSLLDNVDASSRHGAEIVAQVQTFAQTSNVEAVPMQTRHLLREAVMLVQATFPRSIRLKTDLPRDLHLVLGSATQLHQALLSLCVNAREAMPAGGTLTLAGRNAVLDDAQARTHPEAKPGPYVVWSIEDTGAGIPPEHRERIFEPYFTTKPAGHGAGLGLPTARRIIRSHGGFIEVRSTPGQGALFQVFLPSLSPIPTPRLARQEATADPGHGECVLIVDSEEEMRQPLRLTLERSGYQLLVARDGLEALTLFKWRRAEVRLVVTEALLPRLSGLRLVEALRTLAPAIRIVLMTGTSDPATRAQIDLLKVNGFLEKPFTSPSLLATIRAALAEPTEAP